MKLHGKPLDENGRIDFKWHFDRYRKGQILAEGVCVHAPNCDEALKKAIKMYDVYPECKNDEYVLNNDRLGSPAPTIPQSAGSDARMLAEKINDVCHVAFGYGNEQEFDRKMCAYFIQEYGDARYALGFAENPDVVSARWAVNVLLEKIAATFEANDTWDIWKSDAATLVRSFKHYLWDGQ